MIVGAAILRLIISAGGLIIIVVMIGLWVALRPRLRAPRVLLALALTFYGLAGSYALAERGNRWLASPFHELTREDVPAGRVAVVLLGSGSWTFVDWRGRSYHMLDPIGMTRTLEAARVAKLLDAQWVISSGGDPGSDDSRPAAGATMRETLIRLGTPADRILVEQDSWTTRDEAIIVSGMLRSLEADHVVLVTSGMHMRRSLAVFRSAGVDAIPAIARDSGRVPAGFYRVIPTAAGLDLSHYVIHEIAGLAYYRLRGWQR